RPALPTLFPYTTLFRSLATYPSTTVTSQGLGFHNNSSGAFQAAPDGVSQRRDGLIAIRMPSVTLADAKGLDQAVDDAVDGTTGIDRKSTRLNSSHLGIS